jgi:hypothetical protein
MPLLPDVRVTVNGSAVLSAKTRERLRQAAEALFYTVVAAAASAVADYFFEHPDLTSEGFHHLEGVAVKAGIVAGLMYFKTKFRLPEAHLPELGSRGDRHTDPPPPPLPVVAVAKAAVEAMKNGQAVNGRS